MATKSFRRRVPWLFLLETAWLLRGYWVRLPKHDRAELIRLLRKSKGLPQNLTPRERSELKRIVFDLNLHKAAVEMAPLGKKLKKRL